ncbi:hypothetical protein [Xiashengella succiniciproducens]|jgi:hypothetical protein|uniref:Uncharacterized protein n=1 Tax=Xiashengella succiniciproducens TaxID=2949635 RepID=A0A9J6ZTK0_9BACT|nr:hypothetical protein [Alkaliflexus sp. Ai-910]URW80958.1 hypothetical protein M9189_06280 [Alkaliflexus sp. Ai-910]
MRFITGLLFILNSLLWVAGTIGGLALFIESIGFPILIGFLGYLIAWKISGESVTSASDYFFQPEWNIFATKIKWSNSTGLMTTTVAYIIFSVLGWTSSL